MHRYALPLCLTLIAIWLAPATALAGKRKRRRRARLQCAFPVYPAKGKLRLDKAGKGRLSIPNREGLMLGLSSTRARASSKTPPASSAALAALWSAEVEIPRRAKRAGWTLVRTGVMLDGGSPSWTFVKARRRRLCSVSVTLNSSGGMTFVTFDGRLGVPEGWGTIDYSFERHAAPPRVAGFPLCVGLSRRSIRRRRTSAGLEVSATCPSQPDVWVGRLPRLYGWKRVGESTSWRKGERIVKVEHGPDYRHRWLIRRRR